MIENDPQKVLLIGIGNEYRSDDGIGLVVAGKKNVPAKFFHYSTHAFSMAEAIELARAMNTLPPKLFIYGIESANFSAGVGISHAVQEAANRVVGQILKKIRKIR